MSNNQNSTGKDFLVGIILGGLVGAATALFLTPKAGTDLRKDVTEQAKMVKEKTNEISKDAYRKGIVLVDYAKTKTNAVSQALSGQSTHMIEKVKSGSIQLKDLVKNNDETLVDLEENKIEELELLDVINDKEERVADQVQSEEKVDKDLYI